MTAVESRRMADEFSHGVGRHIRRQCSAMGFEEQPDLCPAQVKPVDWRSGSEL